MVDSGSFAQCYVAHDTTSGTTVMIVTYNFIKKTISLIRKRKINLHNAYILDVTFLQKNSLGAMIEKAPPSP